MYICMCVCVCVCVDSFKWEGFERLLCFLFFLVIKTFIGEISNVAIWTWIFKVMTHIETCYQ